VIGVEDARAVLTAVSSIKASSVGVWRSDPVAWAHDLIDWRDEPGLTGYQEEILSALVEHNRVVVRAPRGSGKTMPAAIAALWFATTRDGEDWKVPTTAGVWRQLTRFLWPEIHKWAKRVRWDKLHRDPPNRHTELLTLTLNLNTGSAFALASDTADALEGAHAANLLAIVDEGKLVPDASWDAIEGYFSDPGEKLVLAQSVPGAPVGRFFDIHNRKPGYEDWHAIHVTIDQAVNGGRVESDWVEQRKKQWGVDSPLYLNHVLAEFGGEEDGVIPLSWIEAAMGRWDDLDVMPRVSLVSADIADGGEDDTVLALRAGDVITELRRYSEGDTMLQADRVARLVPKGGKAIVDSIGVGAGVYSQLQRLLTEARAVGFVASQATKMRDKSGEMRFVNKRSAAWWNLRELLEPPSDLAMPADPLLLGDLTAPRWAEMAGGKIQVESKDTIRQRLGRSTDAGDAVVMAFWEEAGPSRRSMEGWSNTLTRSSPNRPT